MIARCGRRQDIAAVRAEAGSPDHPLMWAHPAPLDATRQIPEVHIPPFRHRNQRSVIRAENDLDRITTERERRRRQSARVRFIKHDPSAIGCDRDPAAIVGKNRIRWHGTQHNGAAQRPSLPGNPNLNYPAFGRRQNPPSIGSHIDQ